MEKELEKQIEIPKGEERVATLELEGLKECKLVATRDNEGKVHFRSACSREESVEKLEKTMSSLYTGGEVTFHKTKVIKAD